MVQRHPEASLLSEYAGGSVSPALCAAITAHLHFCTECRSHNKALCTVGASLLENADAVEVSGSLLDSVMSAIDSGEAEPVIKETVKNTEQDFPDVVQRLLPESGPQWKSVSPSLKAASLPVGEEQFELALHRIKAGGMVPEHDHKGMEYTVVVRGSFSDEEGVYREGDFIVKAPGDIHRPLAAKNEECICLSVVEAPIRMTGIKALLNPFLSFKPA